MDYQNQAERGVVERKSAFDTAAVAFSQARTLRALARNRGSAG